MFVVDMSGMAMAGIMTFGMLVSGRMRMSDVCMGSGVVVMIPVIAMNACVIAVM